MGLDLIIDDTHVDKISSYSWFGTFLDTITGELEGGMQGSKYPITQSLGFFGRTHTPYEAKRILKELTEIRRDFKTKKYPSALGYKDGEVVFDTLISALEKACKMSIESKKSFRLD